MSNIPYQDEQGHIIGNGEDVAVAFLLQLYKLEEKSIAEFPEPGLYRQFPLTRLVLLEFQKKIASYHEKNKVDIVIVKRNRRILVIRVNHKNHYRRGPKPKRDHAQKEMLQDSGIDVIDFPYYEMPHLFKNEYSWNAKQEIIAVLENAGESIGN